jgi:hypothetical protein
MPHCTLSFDRGGRWVRMNNNMPSVPVRDILVHRESAISFSARTRAASGSPTSALEQLMPPLEM